MSQNNMSFEDAFAALEKITDKLSDNDVPLDEAIKLYEEGMKLSHYCADLLEKAKQKIETLKDGEA